MYLYLLYWTKYFVSQMWVYISEMLAYIIPFDLNLTFGSCYEILFIDFTDHYKIVLLLSVINLKYYFNIFIHF